MEKISTKVKKLTKKEKELFNQNIKLELVKDQLENKKRVYEVYIKVIVRYNIQNSAYSAIMYDELYHNEIRKKMESVRNDPKGFHSLMFGDPKKTEEERIKDSIEYYDQLIEYAKWKIEHFTDEIKTKIAKDAVEKGSGWINLSSERNIEKKAKK